MGRRVVILGSGDIGLIMARRMTLEGAKVLACVELMPYSGGLTRNIVQCLDDYGIPLYLSHTVAGHPGQGAGGAGVTVAKVDETPQAHPRHRDEHFDCDTLLLSRGPYPGERADRGSAGMEHGPAHQRRRWSTRIWRPASPGVFACGNVVHVHDLVDFVYGGKPERAGSRGRSLCAERRGRADDAVLRRWKTAAGVSYTVPRSRCAPVRNVAEICGLFLPREPCAGCLAHCGAWRFLRGGAVLCSVTRRERTAPGEMEQIVLPAGAAAGGSGWAR